MVGHTGIFCFDHWQRRRQSPGRLPACVHSQATNWLPGRRSVARKGRTGGREGKSDEELMRWWWWWWWWRLFIYTFFFLLLRSDLELPPLLCFALLCLTVFTGRVGRYLGGGGGGGGFHFRSSLIHSFSCFLICSVSSVLSYSIFLFFHSFCCLCHISVFLSLFLTPFICYFLAFCCCCDK